MTEETNESVEQEVQASSQPDELQQQVAKEDTQEQRQNNDAERNWAEARRKMKELERQNREMQEMIHQIKAPQKQEEEDVPINDDDILTAAQAKKLAAKIANDVIKKREAATVDERLVNKLPDFAQVVSKENIETLKENEPELAQSLLHIPDPYHQGVAAYKMLKKLGIYREAQSLPEKEKAKANSQKPLSVNAVAKNSAIGNAHLFENGLTKELKTQLWKEMQQAMKGAA